MENSTKYILYLVLAISIISLIVTFTGSSSLNSIRKDILGAKRSADSALQELSIAKNEIDSLHANIATMQSYVTYIQKSVALNESIKIAQESKTNAEIQAAKAKIDSLKKDFRTDSLPPTDEQPLKSKRII